MLKYILYMQWCSTHVVLILNQKKGSFLHFTFMFFPSQVNNHQKSFKAKWLVKVRDANQG